MIHNIKEGDGKNKHSSYLGKSVVMFQQKSII
jgi:hypothetical protein